MKSSSHTITAIAVQDLRSLTENHKRKILNNETKIPKEEITEENLKTLIDEYLVEKVNNTEYIVEDIKENRHDNEYINTKLNLPILSAFLQGFHPV